MQAFMHSRLYAVVGESLGWMKSALGNAYGDRVSSFGSGEA